MTDKIVVLSTCGSAREAQRIAKTLLEERVAACVNVLPRIRSFYRWKGKIENSPEWLMVIKSSREHFDGLRTALEKLHSYEVPEIIALPVIEGATNYLNWLEGELGA